VPESPPSKPEGAKADRPVKPTTQPPPSSEAPSSEAESPSTAGATGGPTSAESRLLQRGLLASSAGQTVGTLLSRASGLARIVVMSVVLGQSLFTDQFNNANTAPNMIYELLLGGVLSATLVPLFSRAADEDDQDASNAIVSTSVVALGILTVLAVLAAPIIHTLFTILLPPAERAQDALVVVPLMRLLLPQIFLYGLMTIISAALHSRGRFVAAAFTPVLGNLVFIATFVAAKVFYSDELAAGDTPKGLLILLGVGTTLGVAVMVFSLFIAVYDADMSFEWSFKPRHPAVAELIRLSGWTLGYAAANQVALIVITAIARRDPTTLSAYQTAFIFFQLPHGLIAVSVMNSIVPVVARAFQARNGPQIKEKYREGMSLTLTVISIAAAMLWFAADPLVSACLGYGLFGEQAQAATAAAVKAFAIGLPGFSAYLLTLRIFYARKDTRTPFFLCLGQNLLNIILILVFLSISSAHPAAQMAMAYSVSYLVAAVAAIIAVNRKMPGLVSPAVATDGAKAIGCAIAGLGVAVGLREALSLSPSDEWLQLVIAGLCGAGALALAIFGLHQFGFGMLRRRGSKGVVDGFGRTKPDRGNDI
jgi:putative peptidoglycan lipid II flippase